MVLVLRLVPTVLSCLLLGAHFLRHGQLFLMGLSLAAPILFAVRRPWSRRVLQALLLVAAVIWVLLDFELVGTRQAQGQPWMRLAIILGAVAAWNILALALLQGSRVGRWFGAAEGAEASAAVE